MKFRDPQEFFQTMAVRKATGKKVQTCLMCLKQANGNFRRAVALCSGEPPAAEGDRRR